VDLSWIEPPPTWDGWTLAPDTLGFLVRLVERLRPRHVLEFGTGLSTRVLARACSALTPPGRLSSVDHDPEFGRMAARASADRANGGRHVRCQVAPLVARDCGGKLLPTYLLRPERFASRKPVDLVVIDGPTGVLGGREGTLYQALEFARPGTVMLLDDAARSQERDTVARWRDNLGEAIDVALLPGFSRGLAAVVVETVVRRRDLWAHRARLSQEDVAAIVAPGHSVIVVDDNRLGSEIARDRRSIPFLERNGEYWGSPADDAAAIRELERLRQAGARAIVFLWPAFWWLEYYAEFHGYLRSTFRRGLANDRVVAFDLEARVEAGDA
jgi:predicted O-methyltransferase YrrM